MKYISSIFSFAFFHLQGFEDIFGDSKKVEPKPTLVRPKDSGLKIPVSEIDPSLLVFASKSKPRPAKQTVSVSFHL